jgi:hypothetical protein
VLAFVDELVQEQAAVSTSAAHAFACQAVLETSRQLDDLTIPVGKCKCSVCSCTSSSRARRAATFASSFSRLL